MHTITGYFSLQTTHINHVGIENHAEAHTLECYICKKQPLVFVENSDIANLHFGPRNKNCIIEQNAQCGNHSLNDLPHLNLQTNTGSVEKYESVNANSPILYGQPDPGYNIEQDIPFDRDVMNDDSISVIDMETKEYVQINSNFQILNEEQDDSPIDADYDMEETVPLHRDLVEGDCNPTLELLSVNEECEELPISEQPTALHDEAAHKDVIDISSESDDEVEAINDDDAEIFYCYFCDAKFTSLNNFGVHVKMCSTIN